METQLQAGEEERHGVPTFAVEAGVALLLLALGLLVVISSFKLGAGWTSDGPGAGYFPFYVGLILCISSAVTLYQALLGKKRNMEIFVDSEQLKRVLTVLIPAAVYVGAVTFLGLYIASAIYVAGFMIWLGKFSPVKSVTVAVVMVVLLFLMFEVWFKVPLYKGTLQPLAFLGY
jgi:hypothetical protein